MHNPMRILLSTIHHSIPEVILNLAFNPHNLPMSIDDSITQKVIQGRVLLDCNVVAGKPKQITLDHRYIEQLEYTPDEFTMNISGNSVYRIPDEVREGRNIVKSIGLEYPGYVNNMVQNVDPYRSSRRGATVTRMARAALESQTMSTSISTPAVEIVSGDMIRLTPHPATHINFIYQCLIEYDEDFNGINPQAIRPLKQLILCATKSYIYNKIIVEIDQARIIHGSDHGIIRDIISKYEDEEEKYQEHLSQFHGGAAMTATRRRRILHQML